MLKTNNKNNNSEKVNYLFLQIGKRQHLRKKVIKT